MSGAALTSAAAPSAADLVEGWARSAPDRVCLIFYEREEPVDRVTYGALWEEALAFASLFRARGLRPGDPVVLVAQSARPFVSAFLGAQRAGLLAVPCPPLDPLEPRGRAIERVTRIVEQSGARALVASTLAEDESWRESWRGVTGTRVPWLTPADLARGGGARERAASAGDRGAFAYCQFTSGSGGRAKGVLLTHANVLANIRARGAAYQLGADDVAVSWLPLFHDMGLVGYVLDPLASGYPSHLMSARAFIARPAAWLRLLSRVHGTMSTAPNVAFALCARRVTDEELAGVDLSSWRRAVNGSEPIVREVVEAFTRRFASVGFQGSALLAGYGLAENTLTAASRRPGEGMRFDELSRRILEDENRAASARPDESRVVIASVGRPLPGQEVAVFDSGGTPLGERRVGEIALRGPSVMHGYLPGTEEADTLRPDGWLLTGDLGYLADSEVFIVGRKKDLIVRAGRNYYPQDLEEAASQVSGVRTGRVAAFSVPGGAADRVVLAAECRLEVEGEPLSAAIRQAVFEAVRFVPDEIWLLPPHALPLTTSGKVMRPGARRLYLERPVDA